MGGGLGLIHGNKMAVCFLWAAVIHRLVCRVADIDSKNHTQRIR